MLKRIVVIFLCLFLAGTAWSQRLLVSGAVVKNRHFYPGGGTEIQYEVALTVSNTGSESLVFDAVVARFFSTPYAYKIEKVMISTRAIFVIQPGESQTFSFGTNGNSSRLWSEAGDQSINFGFFLKHIGEQTSGFYYTVLPDTGQMAMNVAQPLAFKR
jgi:hypothetical protein